MMHDVVNGKYISPSKILVDSAPGSLVALNVPSRMQPISDTPSVWVCACECVCVEAQGRRAKLNCWLYKQAQRPGFVLWQHRAAFLRVCLIRLSVEPPKPEGPAGGARRSCWCSSSSLHFGRSFLFTVSVTGTTVWWKAAATPAALEPWLLHFGTSLKEGRFQEDFDIPLIAVRACLALSYVREAMSSADNLSARKKSLLKIPHMKDIFLCNHWISQCYFDAVLQKRLFFYMLMY